MKVPPDFTRRYSTEELSLPIDEMPEELRNYFLYLSQEVQLDAKVRAAQAKRNAYPATNFSPTLERISS